MGRNNLIHIIYSVVILALIGALVYYIERVEQCEDSIDDLYSLIDKQEVQIQDLNNVMEDLSERNESTTFYQNEKIKLQQQELQIDKNRQLQQDVFLELIKDTPYEDYVIAESYRDNNRPKLTKVTVSITGTENVINYLQHLSSKCNFLYFKENMN